MQAHYKDNEDVLLNRIRWNNSSYNTDNRLMIIFTVILQYLQLSDDFRLRHLHREGRSIVSDLFRLCVKLGNFPYLFQGFLKKCVTLLKF